MHWLEVENRCSWMPWDPAHDRKGWLVTWRTVGHSPWSFSQFVPLVTEKFTANWNWKGAAAAAQRKWENSTVTVVYLRLNTETSEGVAYTVIDTWERAKLWWWQFEEDWNLWFFSELQENRNISLQLTTKDSPLGYSVETETHICGF